MKLKELLKNNPLFENLNNEQLEIIVPYLEKRFIRKMNLFLRRAMIRMECI
ncbi:MAG: hypothetical protein AB1765_07305 [Candidatus Hydrogenedentota bacterium]